MHLTCVATPDGSLKAQAFNSAVPNTLLVEISNMLSEQCSMEDVVTCLRLRTVPKGYAIHPWVPGEKIGQIIVVASLECMI